MQQMQHMSSHPYHALAPVNTQQHSLLNSRAGPNNVANLKVNFEKLAFYKFLSEICAPTRMNRKSEFNFLKHKKMQNL